MRLIILLTAGTLACAGNALAQDEKRTEAASPPPPAKVLESPALSLPVADNAVGDHDKSLGGIPPKKTPEPKKSAPADSPEPAEAAKQAAEVAKQVEELGK